MRSEGSPHSGCGLRAGGDGGQQQQQQQRTAVTSQAWPGEVQGQQ